MKKWLEHSLPLLLALTLLVGCGEEDPRPQVGQQQADDMGQEEDTADQGDPEDMSDGDEPDAALDMEPEPEPSCGDATCQAEAGEDADTCPRDCVDAPVALHDPTTGYLHSYPDDFFTVEADTPTGRRVHIPEDAPVRSLAPLTFRRVFDDLSTLDGFGVSAGAYFQFSQALDRGSVVDGEGSDGAQSPLLFGYLDEQGDFVRIPVELLWTDEDSTVILRPMRPLPPRARALAGATRGLKGAGGADAQPGAPLRSLLDGTAKGALEPLLPRYAEATDALRRAGIIEGHEDLAALTVFTTQSTWQESALIAQDIQSRPHQVERVLGCQDEANYRTCEITFQVGNYRDEDGIVAWDGQGPVSTYEMTAVVYLPLEPVPELGRPYPICIFGHGLSGERHQARHLARFAAPRGLATVAIDAVEHGEHPARHGNDRISSLLAFFGFDAFSQLVGRQLRDNWRQATYDKLALIEVLKQGVDLDEDGQPDLDAGRLMYLGASLGGIMGSELSALSPDLDAVLLVIAGARVTDILQFSDFLGPVVDLLSPAGTSEGEIIRFFPLLQTVVDRGDPVSYAPHVLRDRLIDGPTPDVLMGNVLDDEIVPEPTNFTLARALDIPHIQPVRRPVPLLALGDAAPVRQNLPEGVTAGLVQLDVIFENNQWKMATHNNVSDSDVGAELWLRFMEGVLLDGSAEIVDPYTALGLEHP